MSNYVTVSALGPPALQTDPKTSNADAIKIMKKHWRDQIERVLPDKPDLIVLHEACDRFSNFEMGRRLDYYEERGESIRQEMATLATEGQCNIAYSAARKMPDGTYRNMTEVIDRAGECAGTYNKNHLVPVEYDAANIMYGVEPSLIKLDFGTVSPAICFDLNFPELLDKVAALKPDIIVFSSMYHGGLMQPYWAYTARAFFVGACCNLPCSVLSPVGTVIAESTNYFKRVSAKLNLDCEVVHLDKNWNKIEAARDKYKDGFNMFDPGFLGCVVISCEREDMTINDIINEFEIIKVDDYLAGCRDHRNKNIKK